MTTASDKILADLATERQRREYIAEQHQQAMKDVATAEARVRELEQERDKLLADFLEQTTIAMNALTDKQVAEAENARLRAAIYLEVEYLDGPKGAHAYDKHGFHRNDCAACRIRERLRAALDAQAP